MQAKDNLYQPPAQQVQLDTLHANSKHSHIAVFNDQNHCTIAAAGTCSNDSTCKFSLLQMSGQEAVVNTAC